MAKKTGSVQGSTAEKKQKTSHSAANFKRKKPDTTFRDEDLRSPFTVQELFQRVPSTVVEEIFDHLDVRQVKRLSKSIYFMDNYFRHSGWKVHLETLDLTTLATSDARMLSNLDLAFLGRLLVAMDKLKPIPGFQPPPFPFPDEIHFAFVASRR